MSVSLATRGKDDMRGLVNEGRDVRMERIACLGKSVIEMGRLIIDVSRVDNRDDDNTWSTKKIGWEYYSSTAREKQKTESSRAMANVANV